MEGIKIQKDRLALRFLRGRMDLWIDSRQVTEVRGMRAFFRCREGWNDSTEAVWSELEEGPDGVHVKGRLSVLPVELDVHLSVVDVDAIGIRIEAQLLEPLEIRSAGMQMDLVPDYPGWASEAGRWALPAPEPWTQLVWCGVPRRGYVSFVGPGTGLPDLRFLLRDECPLKEARVFQRARSDPGGTLEWIRMEGDRGAVRLEPCRLRFFDGLVRIRPEPSAAVFYPKDLFVQGPIRNVLLVNRTGQAHFEEARQALRRSLPRHALNGSLEPVEVAECKELPRRSLFSWLLRRRPDSPYDLVGATVDRIHEGYGLRFNLRAALLGTPYKLQFDRAGCWLFHTNTPRALLVRQTQGFRLLVKRWLRRLCNAVPLTVNLVTLAFLFCLEGLRSSFGRRRGMRGNG